MKALNESLPTRGAWIEILVAISLIFTTRSLPTRGAWIEIASAPNWALGYVRSLPTRGAWIEIVLAVKDGFYGDVAPHTGSVD